jgi:hypothetical protein
VVGCGDGGIYTTTDDVHRLWDAASVGAIVAPELWALMTTPLSDVPAEEARYGLGVWLGAHDDSVRLEGYDAGVSFRSVFSPGAGTTYTVISNWTDGAWPMCRAIAAALA